MSDGLCFSSDTLVFDTVFTSMGSATRVVMLYNRNSQPLTIRKVVQQTGSPFLVNIDGESDKERWTNLVLPAGDSMFLFVKASIDPQNSNSPVLVTDQLVFQLENGDSRKLQIEAYGQDVQLIDSLYLAEDYTLSAEKPYLVRHYIASAPNTHLTIEPGATFYMHNGAELHVYGSVTALGTSEAPIQFVGDRLDDYIINIPYAYVPGQWSGIYLNDYKGLAPTWELAHIRVISASNGLFCIGKSYQNRPKLLLNSARLHNHDHYGLVLQNVDAEVSNSEISNCASYLVYLDGGNSTFVHNTIASYYRHTQHNSNVGLYDTQREDVAAIYIKDISKQQQTMASFYNNIITGVRKNQLMIAAPLPHLYGGEFRNNCIKTDTLLLPNASGNVYVQENDTIFRNDYYVEQRYYDFRLDSISPARGIADPTIAANYPYDLNGEPRQTADAGCYVYTAYSDSK